MRIFTREPVPLSGRKSCEDIAFPSRKVYEMRLSVQFASPSFFSHLVAAVAVVVAEVLRTATGENIDIPGFCLFGSSR